MRVGSPSPASLQGITEQECKGALSVNRVRLVEVKGTALLEVARETNLSASCSIFLALGQERVVFFIGIFGSFLGKAV
jgi:hypothetical protein